MNKAVKHYLNKLNLLVQDLSCFNIDYDKFLDYIYIMLTQVGTDEELSKTDKLFLKVKIHKTAAEVL